MICGLLIGAALGAFDILYRFIREEDVRGALAKILKASMGGIAGGFLGGFLSRALHRIWEGDAYWSPSATGFVALGLCIGLMIGLAQVFFRQAWLKVEAGFRAGRELILTKPETTIGRAESCDVGLFGDSAVDRLHARIIQKDDGYLLVDAGSKGGTFVNDVPVAGPTPLHSGDVIQVGKSVLSFQERMRNDE